MSEKEDLMALAFMVGGEIHNIKQTSENRGRFVSEGLPNPRDFVLNVANQDISRTIEEGKKQSLIIQNKLNAENPNRVASVQPQPIPNPSTNSNNDAILYQILDQLKITNDYLKKLAFKQGLL